MKKLTLVLPLAIIAMFSSCKKGCTDPYAYNYNSKKKKDNGSCTVYSNVTLNSIKIETIPALNPDGETWDNATNNDYDQDNTYPDLFVSFSAEGGYDYIPNTYFPDVNPAIVNRTQSLGSPISVTEWQDGNGFWVYFYEADYQGAIKIKMDSVLIEPFEMDASSDRFKDTLMVTKGDISFEARMEWN